MEFADIIENLLEEEKFQRQEWPQGGTYICIRDEKLMVFTPEGKTLHPLIISMGSCQNKIGKLRSFHAGDNDHDSHRKPVRL